MTLLEKWKALIESNKLISLHGTELHLPGEIRRRAKIKEVYWHKVSCSSHLFSHSTHPRAIKWNRRRVHTAWGARCEREKKRCAVPTRQLIILHSPISSDEPVESMREARTQQLNRIRTQREINKTRSPSLLNFYILYSRTWKEIKSKLSSPSSSARRRP